MDKQEFEATDKDGAKQAQLSRLITRFNVKYQDYYAPVNCIWPGIAVGFFGGVFCAFISFMFPGFWDRDFAENFGFNGLQQKNGLQTFLPVACIDLSILNQNRFMEDYLKRKYL